MSDSRRLILDAVRHSLSSMLVREPAPNLPSWGQPITETIERFRFEWERNGGDWFEWDGVNENELSKVVSYFREELAATSAWIANEPICKLPFEKHFKEVQVGDSIEDGFAARCELGIAGCETLLAETGTVAEAARPGRPRALTLLPPNVLFVVNATQFINRLEDALARLATQAPHGWVWISGPSRTADIEKVLIKGVHGPKRVAVLLLNDSKKDNR